MTGRAEWSLSRTLIRAVLKALLTLRRNSPGNYGRPRRGSASAAAVWQEKRAGLE